jgi:3D-(3,5/4)-trihydroxycyclohexane-1,2-dione acylhydrolase (decyclizing)
MHTGNERFNNLYADCNILDQPQIDYVAHAASMGARAVKAESIADLEAKLRDAKSSPIPTVIVIDTDPMQGPGEAGGGFWWDVAVPEVARSEKLQKARAAYEAAMAEQNLVN